MIRNDSPDFSKSIFGQWFCGSIECLWSAKSVNKIFEWKSFESVFRVSFIRFENTVNTVYPSPSENHSYHKTQNGWHETTPRRFTTEFLGLCKLSWVLFRIELFWTLPEKSFEKLPLFFLGICRLCRWGCLLLDILCLCLRCLLLSFFSYMGQV